MALETNLNVSPYFDDFNEEKNFHRVLFRPGYAVQARELTQMQSILQNQIERFANKVIEDGKVISGCSPALRRVGYVKLRDRSSNNRVMLLNDFYDSGSIGNYKVIGATTGIEAELIDALEGSEIASPNYLSVFVRYINSGANNTTKTFVDNEIINFYTNDASNTFVVSANTITSNASGYALRADVKDGLIYHKGNFTRVNSQGVIVGRYTLTPNCQIGFETRESVVDSNIDSSLLDNATGSTNFSAPGANRLKLTPILATRDIFAANTTTFFPIAYVEDGNLVQKTNSDMEGVNAHVAKRIHDIHGDFAAKPFNIRIREHLKKDSNLGRYTTNGDSNKLIAEIEAGIGYVSGNRVELLQTVGREINKAKTSVTETRNITMNIGGYVKCKEVAGVWNVSTLPQVDLYDTAGDALSGNNTTPSGSKIGTAFVRGFENGYVGEMGHPNGDARIYLFNIKMNSGKSFKQDVKSFYIQDGTATGVNSMADPILNSSSEIDYEESNLASLVFPFKQKGTAVYPSSVSSTAFTGTSFVYRQTVDNATLVSGVDTATVSFGSAHAGGTDYLNNSGAISEGLERDYVVVAKNAVYSDNKSGTINVTANTVVGTGTFFQDEYEVGDYISYNGELSRIHAITSQINMELNDQPSTSQSGVTHAKYYRAGHIFDFTTSGVTGKNMTGTGSTLTLDFNETYTTDLQLIVTGDIKRVQSSPAAKYIRKNRWVRIDTSTHGATTVGPWCLGVPDGYKLNKVYKDISAAAVANTSTDVTSDFKLNSGMKDTHYDLAQLQLKTNSSLSITSGDGLLVQFEYFELNTSMGAGYFTVDSYPINDANTAYDPNNISSIDIPVYQSPKSGQFIDLRDALDCRPYATNTAAPTLVETAAPTNPSDSYSTFQLYTNDSFVPTNGENFETDIEYYLPRKDRIVLTKEGKVVVVAGTPAVNPRTPTTKAGSMSLATINIPPYPSLSPYVAAKSKRLDYGVSINIDNNKRYTMRDFRTWEERVKRLEYYTTLSSVQAGATNKQIIGNTGLDRFKNGIFVDTFSNHSLIDTSKEGFAGSIDRKRNVFRPSFEKHTIDLKHQPNFQGSTSVISPGDGSVVLLAYDETTYLNQKYASKRKNPVQEIMFEWKGDVLLDPSIDNTPSVKDMGDVQVNLTGVYDSMVKLAELSGATGFDWGEWETLSDVTKEEIVDSWGDGTFGGETTEFTQVIDQVKQGKFTSVDPSIETFDFGTTVENVAVRPYMRSRPIKFTGVNLRPSTRVYPYFDDEDVAAYCVPTNRNFSNTVNGSATSLGDPIVTNANGYCYGVFTLPEDNNLKFRVGTRRFKLMDIDDPETQTDTITTSAFGDYTSIPLDVHTHGTELNLTVPKFSTEAISENRTVTNVTTSETNWDLRTWDSGDGDGDDPLAQTFSVSAGASDGIFVTQVGLYFAAKDANMPFRVEIREIENGVPTSTTVPFGTAWKESKDIITSSNSTAETKFKFKSPVFLRNGKDYGLVLKPGGNSTSYQVWVAELGGSDVVSSALIASPPQNGVMMSSSNDRTWSPIQKEDLKYTLYKAQFTTANTGYAYVTEDDTDYFKTKNTNGTFLVGEKVTSSTNERGFVKYYDAVKGELYLEDSTGNFATQSVLTGQKSGANTTIKSVFHIPANVIVPKIPVISYSNTYVAFSSRTSSSAGISTSYKDIDVSTSNEYRDSAKRINSASNNNFSAVESSTKNFVTKVEMFTADPNVSPVIDAGRMNAVCIGNIINNVSTNEDNTQGDALVRYISKPIQLEDGQDAEDLKVWITAYKPVGTEIKVYARLLSANDPEDIDDKSFTPLTQLTNASTYSDSINVDDYKEFEFGISSTQTGTQAYLDPSDSDIVHYTDAGGTDHKTFKQFAIKIVMTSSKTEIVPICSDVRAIALQK